MIFIFPRRCKGYERVGHVAAGGSSRIWGAVHEQADEIYSGRLSIALSLGGLLLPAAERSDRVEENPAYLADAEGRWSRYWWVIRQLLAMPRYAYTVRTDSKKESA
jgi:hypothetical protein